MKAIAISTALCAACTHAPPPREGLKPSSMAANAEVDGEDLLVEAPLGCADVYNISWFSARP